MIEPDPMVIYRDEAEMGAILFHVETGESLGLNRTAQVIWESIMNGADRTGILDALEERFSDIPEAAAEAVDAMLETLSAKGFLHITESHDEMG